MSTLRSLRSSARSGIGRGIVRDLVLAAPVAPAIALLGARRLGYDPGLALAVLAVYAAAALLILRGAPPDLPGAGLGPANRATLGRLVVGLPIAGFAVFPQLPGPSARWAIVGLAGLVLALDGVDGWIARRTRTVTRFGARFDMETDAALLLALSILAWRVGPVGAWVLGIGLLRYLFLAAGSFAPRLRGDLPEGGLRRKTVCVIQGIALPAAVAPLGISTAQAALAATALGLLIWSFAVDVAWLMREGGRAHHDLGHRSR